VLRLVHEAPASLDPIRVASVYESLPVNQIFDGLVAVDASLHVTPALASTWTISRDQRTYTFHLRSGVRFHDGTMLTAADVVFSLRRVLDPAAPVRNVAADYLMAVEGAPAFSRGDSSDLAGLEAVDESTVRIRLARPYVSFLEVLAMDGARVVPRSAFSGGDDGTFGTRPVGTGPFRLARWDEAGMRLEANPDHFRGRPHLDAVEILFLAPDEMDAGSARFERGEIDVLEPPTDQLERIAARTDTRVVHYQELNLSFLGFGTRLPPPDDPRVRQAIAHAIDREGIVADAPSARRLATGILPPGLQGYSPSPKVLGYDPDLSRSLLAEAGHPGGAGLEPVVLYSSSRSAAVEHLVDRLRRDLGAVGIHLEVRNLPWGELNEAIEAHRAPAFLLAWIPDLADPDSFLRTLFQSGTSANYFRFEDPEIDRLLFEGAIEMNPVLRAGIYRRIEQGILEQAPLIPLYHTVGMKAQRVTVRDLDLGPFGISAVDLERAWFADGGARP